VHSDAERTVGLKYVNASGNENTLAHRCDQWQPGQTRRPGLLPFQVGLLSDCHEWRFTQARNRCRAELLRGDDPGSRDAPAAPGTRGAYPDPPGSGRGEQAVERGRSGGGVRSQLFGVFHDAGYLGQYTLDAENIRIYKGIPEGGEILDYMGREELAANLFRITQTEGRLRREQIVGEDAAIQAHYRVGREVRDTLKRLGATMPEDLPTAESIRGELERQRRARQKIQSQQQKDQDSLF
jgi:hypothetical protein